MNPIQLERLFEYLSNKLSKANFDRYECPARLSVRFFPFRELTPRSADQK